MEWKVVSESQPESQEEVGDANESKVGLKKISEITRADYSILIVHLFLNLSFKVSLCSVLFHSFINMVNTFCSSSKDWKTELAKPNEALQETNEKERGSKIRPFTEKEFLKALGITIAAVGFNCRGCELWAKKNTELPASVDLKTQ